MKVDVQLLSLRLQCPWDIGVALECRCGTQHPKDVENSGVDLDPKRPHDQGMRNAILTLTLALAAGCSAPDYRLTVDSTWTLPADASPELTEAVLEAFEGWTEAGYPHRLSLQMGDVTGNVAAHKIVLAETDLVDCEGSTGYLGCAVSEPDNGPRVLTLGRKWNAATIAHELGHALGLEHTDNDHALMYFEENGISSPTLIDGEALKGMY